MHNEQHLQGKVNPLCLPLVHVPAQAVILAHASAMETYWSVALVLHITSQPGACLEGVMNLEQIVAPISAQVVISKMVQDGQ